MWEIVFIFSLPKFVVVESVIEVRLVQDTRVLQVAVDAAGDAALNLQFFKKKFRIYIHLKFDTGQTHVNFEGLVRQRPVEISQVDCAVPISL